MRETNKSSEKSAKLKNIFSSVIQNKKETHFLQSDIQMTTKSQIWDFFEILNFIFLWLIESQALNNLIYWFQKVALKYVT